VSCAQALLFAFDAFAQEPADECAAVARCVDSVNGVEVVKHCLGDSGVEEDHSMRIDNRVLCFGHVRHSDA
jgi:hypothetical protein